MTRRLLLPALAGLLLGAQAGGAPAWANTTGKISWDVTSTSLPTAGSIVGIDLSSLAISGSGAEASPARVATSAGQVTLTPSESFSYGQTAFGTNTYTGYASTVKGKLYGPDNHLGWYSGTYLQAQGGTWSIALPGHEAYFQALVNLDNGTTAPSSIVFENDGQVVGSLSGSSLQAATTTHQAWSFLLTASALQGASFDQVLIEGGNVVTGTFGNYSVNIDGFNVADMGFSPSAQPLHGDSPSAPSPAPLPALGATLPGLLALAAALPRRRRRRA